MVKDTEGGVPLRDRIVLITGVSRREGLGYALARAAAEEGAQVVLTARDGDTARALAAEIGAGARGRVEGRELDLVEPRSVSSVGEALERDHGRLDVLINNAAGTNAFGESAATADLDAARTVMDVTLFGTWRLLEVLLPMLRRSDHGRIVNVTSGAGSHGDERFGLRSDNAMGPGYGVAKAALNALTDRLAHEEGRREGSRLLVNAVCPGFTATFEGGAAMGARAPAESVPGVLWAARLPDDGPSGGFFRDGEPLPW